MVSKDELWPSLPWSEWRETAMTIHLFTQIVGKIRLGLMPMEAEWAQVPLMVTSRGLASVGMPTDFGSLDIAFDFISHSINFSSSNGRKISFQLQRHSVADFYADVLNVLRELSVNVKINPMSVEMPNPVRMDLDNEHNTYDGNAVQRWWHVLISVASVFEEYRSGFWGKQTPVSFFWGTFDLATVRFSGKPATPPEGADLIYRVGADAEQIEVGFWPGDDTFPEPAFFAFTYPKPDDIEKAILSPVTATWSKEKGEFILPYESIRTLDDPGKVLLEFCESSYKSGATLAGWDTASLEWKPPLDSPKSKI